MTTVSIREQAAAKIHEALKEIQDPKPVLVTRDQFEVTELAITQFPALSIQQTQETRTTISMGTQATGRRQGVITFQIRGFVRGVELDKKRNELLASVEQAIDLERYLGVTGITDSQIVLIEIVPRLQPLAEFIMTLEVTYNYLRGTQ